MKPEIRCKNCRPRPSELTTSDKLARLYAQQEDIDDVLKTVSPTLEFLNKLLETLDFAIGEVEEVEEEYSISADNMEEYFPGSYQVDEIRDKADACAEWRDELENVKDEVEALIDEWEQLDEKERITRIDKIVDVVEDAISSLRL